MRNREGSTEMFAQFEAQASLGALTYADNPRVARVYTLWLIRRRREAEAVRAERRKARERRWRAIASGELDALTTFEADEWASREAFVSQVTLEDEFRRNRINSGPPRVTDAPERCVPLRGAAERLGVSESTMRQRVWRGRVRGFSLPGGTRGRVVVAIAEVERLEAEAVAA